MSVATTQGAQTRLGLQTSGIAVAQCKCAESILLVSLWIDSGTVDEVVSVSMFRLRHSDLVAWVSDEVFEFPERVRLAGFFLVCLLRTSLLKFTLVVDNDRTSLHGVHTDTVAFSPSVLIKCSICSCCWSLWCTPHEWLKKTIHDKESYFIIMVA